MMRCSARRVSGWPVLKLREQQAEAAQLVAAMAASLRELEHGE